MTIIFGGLWRHLQCPLVAKDRRPQDCVDCAHDDHQSMWALPCFDGPLVRLFICILKPFILPSCQLPTSWQKFQLGPVVGCIGWQIHFHVSADAFCLPPPRAGLLHGISSLSSLPLPVSHLAVKLQTFKLWG